MHPPVLVVALLLFLVTACRAAAAEVKSQDELCAAISANVEHIDVSASFVLARACAGKVRRQIVLRGHPGVFLGFTSTKEPVLDVCEGSLVIRSIALAISAGQSSPSIQGPVPQIISSGGLIVYDQVVFLHSEGPNARRQLPYWASSAEARPMLINTFQDNEGEALDLQQRHSKPWRLREWEADSKQGRQLVVNSSLLTVHACGHGSALVFDFASLYAAVVDVGIQKLSIAGGIHLEAAQCSMLQHAVGHRSISICSTAADSRAVQQVEACLADAGALGVRRIQQKLQLSRKLFEHEHIGSLQAPAVNANATRQLASTAAASIEVSAASPAAPDVQPQKTPDAPRTAADSIWLSPNRAALMAAKYPKGRCFVDAGDFSFPASNAAEFKRLISDNAVTHIELLGDIVLTEDLFPPGEANDRTKGLNITHHVEIRACTGSVDAPVIVDISNLQQQIYVYGFMRWAGNIKFINSYPSPRRAGLWPLISIMSVEEDGIIEFQDLEIHGLDACPLHVPTNPFWSTYEDDPLSQLFVPQPGDLQQLSPYEVLLLNYKFNKSAWVRATQGPNGVSLAVGDGYWHYIDVMITYSAQQQAAQRILQIVLPVVLVSLALVGVAVGVWRWRRRAAAAASSCGDSKPAKDANLAERNISVSNVNDLLAPSQTTATQRQYSTIDSGSKLDASKPSVDTQELIEEARRRMQCPGTLRRDASIILEGLLGEGTFGKVYRGQWQGTDVAVKTMLFPAAMSGKEKREKMAIMETAISSSLSHPNIVQTYTYVVKPLTGELAIQAMERCTASQPAHKSDPSMGKGVDAPEHHGWEVRLVLEYCDKGSLKDLLNNGGLRHPATGKPDMIGIAATALDVARAMLHLHSENVIHSDLKARNVLLKSAGADARGFVAKVSDFGLSVKMDPCETHVSNVYQGTLTHMAPEVLMYGKISRASDVYAFGILLWELYTGQQAFKGTPRVLLGHEVTKMGRRPEFPEDCPFDYQLLACRCWESDPVIRPSFEQILADLQRMACKLVVDSGASPPLPQQAAVIAGQTAGMPTRHQQQQQQQLAMASTAGVSMGAPVACGLDHAKLHNWEPQTSLLDLHSVDRTHDPSVPVVVHGFQHQQPADGSTAGASQGPHSSLSWGTQSVAGFWLGGSLAPSNVPSDVQLPVHPATPDSLAETPAALADEAEVLGRLGPNGQAMGRSEAGMVRPSQRQQHHWLVDIHMPVDLLPQQHHSGQSPQTLVPRQQIPCSMPQQMAPRSIELHNRNTSSEANSVSSSGVYLDDQGSSAQGDPYSCSGPEQQQEGVATALAVTAQGHCSMAAIAEAGESEEEHQPPHERKSQQQQQQEEEEPTQLS